MEPDEIGVVLSRALELHSKISEAIERSNKSSNGDIGETPSSASPPTGRYGSYDDGTEQRGSAAAEGSAEARSLGAIRDALEVLEEQLESLQSIQQQQRTEKHTALEELEESRRSLLTRLKAHRGKEWEVVHETLAFAGEPVEDRDDLRLPPYPMPLSEYSNAGDQAPPYHGQVAGKYNGALKKLSLGVGQSENAGIRSYRREADGSDEENQDVGTSFPVVNDDGGRPIRHSWGFARGFFAHAYGLTTKAAIVVACVAAAVAVGEAGRSIEKRGESSVFETKKGTSPPPITTARQLTRECPPGKKLIVEDGHAICVVKERVELPFPKEIKTPDVLYGRG